MMSESPESTDLLAAAVSELDAERTYCLGCGYSLHRLAQPRCPECGREFDPSDNRTTTKERGERERVRFASSSSAAFMTFFAVPVLLWPLTGILFLDFTTIVGLVMARKLRRKASLAGKWIAGIFGVYLGLCLWAFLAMVSPLDALSWTIRTLSVPAWYPLLLLGWSAVNLFLWNAWEKAKRG